MCIGRPGPVDRPPYRASRAAGGSSQLTELQKRFVPTISGRLEQERKVVTWRFPLELSQSRIAGRKKPSSACTIIAVKLAETIYRQGIRLLSNLGNLHLTHPLGDERSSLSSPSVPVCPSELTSAFINAIIEGNEIHAKLVHDRRREEDAQSETFTIPRALQGCGNVFKELQYVSVCGRLIDNISSFVRGPIESGALADHDQIFMILIAYERAMLLLYDRHNNSIGLMDSHAHLSTCLVDSDAGGVIAVCKLEDIASLVHWMCAYIFPETMLNNDTNQSFEISVIAFAGSLKIDDRPLFIVQPLQKQKHLFPQRRPDQMPRPRQSEQRPLRVMHRKKNIALLQALYR
uniref:Uncharacterized protein n=1 Tax=Ascaris lumbricoides TaxID=6252 RepID=A0A0M3HU06_ASCLU